jgi:3-deoxy-manno-octulosonate cytidylyltransferase (CMP-KDO synthetase)
MQTAAIIPSRYASTRLPGKPLLDIAGKPMIQRVYEAAARAKLVDRVIVATDDLRIVEAVTLFGGLAELTSPRHRSGTDRVAEVADHLPCDIVVNLQGDEPLMDPGLIDRVVSAVRDDPDIYMASAKTPIRRTEDRANPNIVKVVTDCSDFALYFSRSPIPCPFGGGEANTNNPGFRHIGIYVYRKDFLMRLVTLAPSPLEGQERLEQLRVLENGYRIKLVTTDYDAPGVDTPEDLATVRKRLDGLQS